MEYPDKIYKLAHLLRPVYTKRQWLIWSVRVKNCIISDQLRNLNNLIRAQYQSIDDDVLCEQALKLKLYPSSFLSLQYFSHIQKLMKKEKSYYVFKSNVPLTFAASDLNLTDDKYRRHVIQAVPSRENIFNYYCQYMVHAN